MSDSGARRNTLDATAWGRALRPSLSPRLAQTYEPAQIPERLAHTEVPADAPVYRADADGQNVTLRCGYCDQHWRVFDMRRIVIGHMGRTEHNRPDICDRCAEDGTHKVKIPFTRRVLACPACAWEYDAIPLRDIPGKPGEYYTRYLDDTDSPARRRESQREARAFYGIPEQE